MKNYAEEIKKTYGACTEQFQFRLPKNLLKLMEIEAKEQNKSLPDLLREMIIFSPFITNRLVQSLSFDENSLKKYAVENAVKRQYSLGSYSAKALEKVIEAKKQITKLKQSKRSNGDTPEDLAYLDEILLQLDVLENGLNDFTKEFETKAKALTKMLESFNN